MTPFPALLRTRRSITTLTAALLLLCGLPMAYDLREKPAQARPVINNISGRPLACLAIDTPSPGGTSAPEEVVWSAMQHIAASTPVNIQQLEVPPGAASPQPLLSALVGRRCTLIITIGPRLAAAAEVAALHAPEQHFLLADGPVAAASVDITTVDGSSADLTAAVSTQLLHLP